MARSWTAASHIAANAVCTLERERAPAGGSPGLPPPAFGCWNNRSAGARMYSWRASCDIEPCPVFEIAPRRITASSCSLSRCVASVISLFLASSQLVNCGIDPTWNPVVPRMVASLHSALMPSSSVSGVTPPHSVATKSLHASSAGRADARKPRTRAACVSFRQCLVKIASTCLDLTMAS